MSPSLRSSSIIALVLFGCHGAAHDPIAVPTAASQPVIAPSEPPIAKVEPAKPEPAEVEPAKPKTIGCWERELGKAPAADSIGPSLPGPIAGCEGCEQMRVGPNAVGLHVEVLRRVQQVIETLPAPEIDEPVLWINSGKRTGDPDDSMHNQGLAIDAVICGLDTRGTGERLRAAGFTCVIEYYDGAGNPCHFAHGDMRTHPAAVGAYAKDGRKARTCPKRAKSKTMDCSGSSKRDWTYSEG
ncbi:MAG TPA: hypothetical protein VG755_43115 [Nannocystaceae bacterium]|nr:hypothetical protein [Nannocystaceae bacterium]